MNILTLNCGSSTVKYALFDMPGNRKLCHGLVDRVGQAGSQIEHVKSGDRFTHRGNCANHAAALEWIIGFLTKGKVKVVKDLREIGAVGHRVVHGGETFAESVLIDGTVVKSIEELSELAILHNPINLAGISAVSDLMPGVPQVAVFDTAFFSSIPSHAFMYGVPYEWYEKYRIRRYGFHGTSHRFVARRAARLLRKPASEMNLITLHIGNGVSITAVKGGMAYDHSMGFTPLEGAVMGTRCGDLDPSIPLYVMKKGNLAPEEMESILNRKSGLLGITGKYSDRREILKAMEAGDQRAKLSFEIECYRLRKYIGAYMAALGGVNAIVFTGGAGENSYLHREKICEGLDCFGIRLSLQKNRKAGGGLKEVAISSPRSKVKVFVIPTNEELMIAEDTFAKTAGHG
jgi:acetate kinase